ncbi:thiolase-like protein [Aspergillus venezuelensis]
MVRLVQNPFSRIVYVGLTLSLPAGIPIAHISGSRTSVYIGCFNNEYNELYTKDTCENAPYALTGITTTLNANRISWFYNLKGPSINVDTACSSSLVALDIACRGLQAGKAEIVHPSDP